MRSYKVRKSNIGQRADKFIAKSLPAFSRSSLKTLFSQNRVFIGKSRVKPGYKLRPGDTLRADTAALEALPEPIDLPVIYEDKDIVVIDKPAGVLTHSKGALNLEPSVASFIKPKLSDKTLTGNRAGIVHRLDRQTSGVIVAAKNKPAFELLQKQFSSRRAAKEYLTIVEGTPSPAAALIDAPIARHPKKPQTFRVDNNGKPAMTEYELKKTVTIKNGNYSLLRLKPRTGRTHQIRVHLSYIGHPVVGDKIYSKSNEPQMMLHASCLQLVLPGGKKHTFKAEAPAYFNDYLAGD